MAVIPYTITPLTPDGLSVVVTWTPVTEADTCAPITGYPKCSDKSIHVSGTFGGATVNLRGSNNSGASYVNLRTPASAAIAITSEDINAVLENTQSMKPVCTSGSGQSLTMSLMMVQQNPART